MSKAKDILQAEGCEPPPDDALLQILKDSGGSGRTIMQNLQSYVELVARRQAKATSGVTTVGTQVKQALPEEVTP
jgi:hypothetical protein